MNGTQFGRKENAYKKARLRKAETDWRVATQEGAASELKISREKLGYIEQDDPNKRQQQPNPDDVAMMVKVYEAPELADYYCTHDCPLGKGRRQLESNSLDRITVSLVAAINDLKDSERILFQILKDGVVDTDEREKFQRILTTLGEIAYGAMSMELWARKQGMVKTDDDCR